MTARPYCAPRYAAPRKPFAFSPGAQPQAQSCLSPSLDSTESSAGERRERRRERKRGRACSGGAGGPPAGSVPREATLTAGGRRCDTAAPLRRRAGSRLRWPAASAPHCLSQSLRDERTKTPAGSPNLQSPGGCRLSNNQSGQQGRQHGGKGHPTCEHPTLPRVAVL